MYTFSKENHGATIFQKGKIKMNTGKANYYCGAFSTYLISNNVEPVLFDAGKDSTMIRFSIGPKDYKAFIKYSASPSKTKSGTQWNISFTEKEQKRLDEFAEAGRENIVVIVCAIPGSAQKIFSVFPQATATACLGNDSVNKGRRISVYHKKNSHKLQVYGTAVDKKMAYYIPRCCDEYFGFKK